MRSNYSFTLQAEASEAPQPGLLLRTVYGLYRTRFWTWFAITAPTSLIAAGILTLADYRIREIFRSVPRSGLSYHWREDVAATALRFGAYFLSWLLGCFALGAIATEVRTDVAQEQAVAWRHDAHERTREHFGQVLILALIGFGALLVGLALGEMVQLAAARLVGWRRFSRFVYTGALVNYVIVASIVSWLGAAIPLTINRNVGVWTALKRSIELSSGYEGALLLLVVQSVSGPYIAWYAIHYAAQILAPHSFLYTAAGYWTIVLAAVLAGSASDPPIFIAFSVLSEPEKLNPISLFPNSQEPADVHDLG